MRGINGYKQNKFIRRAIALCLIFILIWNVLAGKGKAEGKASFSVASCLLKSVQETVVKTVFPFASFQTTQKGEEWGNLLEEGVLGQMSFASYAMTQGNSVEIAEDDYFYKLLLEEQKKAGKQDTPIVVEDEETDDMLAGMEAENAAAAKQNEEMRVQEEEEVREQESPPEEMPAEQTVLSDGFQKVLEKQVQYDWDGYTTADSLLKEFYAVDSTTKADAEMINLDKLLHKNLTIDKSGEGYQILIYHTHSQEAFLDSVAGDKSTTIVGAGERLAQILTEEYGYRVLHHTGEYDVEHRDDAYSKSLPALEQILEENPEIQVVIDLHRDEVAEGTKLVTDLQGRPTARFMFFNGLSYTRQTGKIDYLANDNLEWNLAFSFQMQAVCNEYFPGLTRRIYLKGYRYNMHLKPRSLLVEMGAQNNTVEEIMNACNPLAQALDMVLSGVVY